MNKYKKAAIYGASIAGLLIAGQAQAVAVAMDTVALTAQFGELNTAQAAIGSLLLVAAGIAVMYKWGKAMIFG